MTDNCIQVLIACPSDVAGFVPQIKEIISSLNNVTQNNGVFLRPVYYRDNSYPELNGEIQAVIDRQLVVKSDILVAVFWKRLGTPTENGKTGTQREIQYFNDLRKQIFLYFMDKAAPMSEIECDQLQKLKEYKSDVLRGKYTCDVKDENDSFIRRT